MTEFLCEIIEIINETHDVKTFRIKRPDNYNFLAGQFTLISIPSHEIFKNKTIPLTISSSPLETKYIDFGVKLLKEFTSALFSLKIGDKIIIQEPRNSKLTFNETEAENKTIVFIAGGSGITPFISILRYAQKSQVNTEFILLYGNRTENDIIYKKELDELEKQNNNIKIINVLNQNSNNASIKNIDMQNFKTFETGFIDAQKIQNHIPNLKESIIYLCGPPKMTKSIKEILTTLEVPKEHMHFEGWELPGKEDVTTT